MIAVVCIIAARLFVEQDFSPPADWRTSLKFFIAGAYRNEQSISIFGRLLSSYNPDEYWILYRTTVVCIFGAIFLKEKPQLHKSTVILPVAVIVILVHYGQVPGIALILATTFAIKDCRPKPPVISSLYETIFMAPIMLCVIVWLELHGAGAFGVESHINTPATPMWVCNSHGSSWAICLCSSENVHVRARFDGIPQSYIGAYARFSCVKEPCR